MFSDPTRSGAFTRQIVVHETHRGVPYTTCFNLDAFPFYLNLWLMMAILFYLLGSCAWRIRWHYHQRAKRRKKHKNHRKTAMLRGVGDSEGLNSGNTTWKHDLNTRIFNQ